MGSGIIPNDIIFEAVEALQRRACPEQVVLAREAVELGAGCDHSCLTISLGDYSQQALAESCIGLGIAHFR